MSSHERQVVRLAVLLPLPGLLVALWLLWTASFAAPVKWSVTALLLLLLVILITMLRETVVRPLQTLSNMLAAIREQDYSLRARQANGDDALGLAMLELNALMDELRSRRLGALEATSLLRRVMAEIDVAVFAFDDADALQIVNATGEQLLGEEALKLHGLSATQLGLAECLRGETPRTIDLAFRGQRARWEVRRGAFRQDGKRNQFVVLADVSRALREEERLAWQRLVRVLGHEINNSITPIKSLSERLQQLLQRAPSAAELDGELRSDLERGLGVISGRSQALSRFLASYTKLVRLPQPNVGAVDVLMWVQRNVRLENRLVVRIIPGPAVTLHADGDQLDQLLINLVRNAVDASLDTGGAVIVGWSVNGPRFTLTVVDEGNGLPETSNLFVPFFTTKQGGTGIGLVLSRQIAEAHGGSLQLTNNVVGRGCEARLTLSV
ncbi:MAG: ATP-binding protein [Gemmatimonadota bacterium]|nr:ATP-binding protein [Gemmatimonadota bacterium]